jgi:cation:H+ antiporter
MSIVLFFLGLALLVVGAESLVRGAGRIATALGVSPLVIGLTIVSFGTSSPELAVSIKAALSGQPDITVGNVVGSNIFNVLFILGLSALIIPLVVAVQLIRVDVPVMISLSVLVLLLSLDGHLGFWECLLLFVGLLIYLVMLIVQSRRESKAVVNEYAEAFMASPESANAWIKNIAMVIVGLALLILGARWLVDAAVIFARYLGVSEAVIGLTIVAVGTSLPEVVTSVIAALRGERDIAVGNVVGSNIFNIMGVLGLTGLVARDGIAIDPKLLTFDMPFMVLVALVCLPIFLTGHRISRGEGAFLLAAYCAYTGFLISQATN